MLNIVFNFWALIISTAPSSPFRNSSSQFPLIISFAFSILSVGLSILNGALPNSVKMSPLVMYSLIALRLFLILSICGSISLIINNLFAFLLNILSLRHTNTWKCCVPVVGAFSLQQTMYWIFSSPSLFMKWSMISIGSVISFSLSL